MSKLHKCEHRALIRKTCFEEHVRTGLRPVRRSGLHAWLICLIFCLAAFADPQQPQQDAAQRSQIPTFSVESNLVVVDVIVRDKKGNLIRDLTREDFKAFEDNVPQEIVTFSREDIPVGPAPESSTGGFSETTQANIVNLNLNPGQTPKKEDLQGKRLVILFFDLSSLGEEGLIRSVDTARQFIAKETGPQDLLAIATYSSTLELVQDFTNDRQVTLNTLNALYPTDSGESTEADLGDTDTSDDVYVPDDVQFNIFNTDRRLSAFETLAKMYREFPERKSLIYFSNGISTTGVENNAQIRSAVDNANRSNMSIYTVDTRGLVALPPGGEASQGSPGGMALFNGGAVSRQMSNLSGSQETLTTLAHDTGGVAFQDTNDLSLALKKVQNDTQSYYVLGYYSKNRKEDGKYRKIRIEIARTSLKIEHRPGYFASKSFRQLNQDERDLQLQQALSVERPFTDLPLILETDYFQSDDKTCMVPLSIEMTGDGLQFQDKGNQKVASFEFLGQVSDPKGRVAAVARDMVQVKLPAEKAEKVKAGGILYSSGFQLRPGNYTLKFIVRDNGTGKLGSFEQSLTVPTLDGKKLDISSIILGNKLVEAESTASGVEHQGMMRRFQQSEFGNDPLQVEGKKIIPSIGNVFLNRQTIYVYFQIYGAAVSADTKKPSLETSLLLLKDESKIMETKPEIIQEWAKEKRGKETVEKKGVATVAISLPLKGLAKGTYSLQVHVRDAIGEANLFQRVPVVIQ
jgi:VWFA-related protein